MFGPIYPHYPGLTLIHRAAGMLQAEVIKGQLETAGIPVMLDYESLGRVFGLTVDGLGEVRVLVPDERAEDARQLLEASASDEAGTAPGEEDDASQT
jgi:hypothetical protein